MYSSVSTTPEGYVILVEPDISNYATGNTDFSNTYTVIDRDGSEVYKSPVYSDVIRTVDGYVYVHDGEDIKLIKWNGEPVYTVVTLGERDKVSYGVMPCGSRKTDFSKSPEDDDNFYGYYKNIGTDEKPEYTPDEGRDGITPGLYITITDIQCANLPGNAVQFCYNPSTGESMAMAFESADNISG